MEISKLPDSLINVSSKPLLPTDLFQQLGQLGSIQARVASISKGQALLNSQLGQILSSNTLDLKTGDLLQIRAGGNEQTPVLKISKWPVQAIKLNASANQTLTQALPTTKPTAALVVGQKANSTLIEISSQIIKIQAQPTLKTGQIVSLEKSADLKSIEVKLVDHQQVLKSAIKQLLPQQAKAQEPTALTQLVKMIQSVSSKITEPPITTQLKQNITAQVGITPGVQSPPPQTLLPTVPSNQTTPSGDSPRLQNNNVFVQLEALVSSLPQLTKLDKTTIQQWVRYILVASQNKSSQSSTASTPYQFLQQVPKSETTVSQQLQQWSQSLSSTSHADKKTGDVKALPDELLLHTSREVIKLAEQSAGQQLLQQTNLRYQQELHQPIALNIAIPLSDQQKTQELRLKIRQRNNEAEPDKQSWDIYLDIEFGMLGMISTHLLLDDGTLSASFWSSEPDTQQKIDSSLSDFKAQISRAGFDLGQFHSFPGKQPETDDHDRLAIPDSLLDIRV